MTERNLVLVVDDDKVVIHLIERILERASFRVMALSSGEAALDLLHTQSQEVALVFVDLAMPGISGTDLAGQMKAEPALAGIPVVAVTANYGPSLQAELSAVGIDEVIEKPFHNEQLFAVLKRHGVPIE